MRVSPSGAGPKCERVEPVVSLADWSAHLYVAVRVDVDHALRAARDRVDVQGAARPVTRRQPEDHDVGKLAGLGRGSRDHGSLEVYEALVVLEERGGGIGRGVVPRPVKERRLP